MQIPKGNRHVMAAVSIVSLIIMAYIDYITGSELIFSAAYLVPVSLCAWYFGQRQIWLMSIASGVVSWRIDMLGGHLYSSDTVQYWNGFTCFLISLVTGLLLHRIKVVLTRSNQMSRDLQKSLADLEASTEEIRKLQAGLVVACAWNKQIQVGDRWMTPEEFLTTHLHLTITHGISPEGVLELDK
jgi:hypothetical protein